MVSIDRSAVILMRIPLCVICCFSLADFNIFSLCLIFVNLINMCLGVFRLGFILFGTLWDSWTCVIMSFCSRSVVLWSLLSVQIFFRWICRGESGLPVLFLCHLPCPTKIDLFKIRKSNKKCKTNLPSCIHLLTGEAEIWAMVLSQNLYTFVYCIHISLLHAVKQNLILFVYYWQMKRQQNIKNKYIN